MTTSNTRLYVPLKKKKKQQQPSWEQWLTRNLLKLWNEASEVLLGSQLAFSPVLHLPDFHQRPSSENLKKTRVKTDIHSVHSHCKCSNTAILNPCPSFTNRSSALLDLLSITLLLMIKGKSEIKSLKTRGMHCSCLYYLRCTFCKNQS